MDVPHYASYSEMATQLASSIDLAEEIDFVDPCPDDWFPVRAQCHANAQAWVDRYPSWSVVRGWLHISGDAECGALFDAHSVVRDPGNRLWDVTQRDCRWFIVFTGDEAQFLAAVRDGPWVQIVYVPPV